MRIVEGLGFCNQISLTNPTNPHDDEVRSNPFCPHFRCRIHGAGRWPRKLLFENGVQIRDWRTDASWVLGSSRVSQPTPSHSLFTLFSLSFQSLHSFTHPTHSTLSLTPTSLLKEADQERFDRLRTVEVKHGRIAMLAVLGHIVTTAGVRLPGNIAFGVPYASMKTGLAAFETIPKGGLWQILLFIGLIEMGFSEAKEGIEANCEEKYSSFCVDRRKSVELNNGRAAQMGILGLMVHEKLDNNPYIINTLFGSPVAFN